MVSILLGPVQLLQLVQVLVVEIGPALREVVLEVGEDEPVPFRQSDARGGRSLIVTTGRRVNADTAALTSLMSVGRGVCRKSRVTPQEQSAYFINMRFLNWVQGGRHGRLGGRAPTPLTLLNYDLASNCPMS